MTSRELVFCAWGALIMLGAGCSGEANAAPQAPGADSQELAKRGRDEDMYVGDVADSSVKRFDARTGAFKGTFVSSGLDGPRGLLFGDSGTLLLVNQNVSSPDLNGDVFEYAKSTGVFVDVVVDRGDPHAPYAPRGMVRKDGRLYVADMGDTTYVLQGNPGPNPRPARVAVFEEVSGRWLGDIAYGGFELTCSLSGCVQWSPRALVFGPDGALYVSLMKFIPVADPEAPVEINTLPGRILRIEQYGVTRLFVDGETCNCGLARPEGLAVGQNNVLYATSFRSTPNGVDSILMFHTRTGAYLDHIDLWSAGNARAFAQDISFGPGGKLYVPISGGGPDTGSVRRYDVRSKTYDVLVAAGGGLGAGWYLTFGCSHSATRQCP